MLIQQTCPRADQQSYLEYASTSRTLCRIWISELEDGEGADLQARLWQGGSQLAAVILVCTSWDDAQDHAAWSCKYDCVILPVRHFTIYAKQIRTKILHRSWLFLNASIVSVPLQVNKDRIPLTDNSIIEKVGQHAEGNACPAAVMCLLHDILHSCPYLSVLE